MENGNLCCVKMVEMKYGFSKNSLQAQSTSLINCNCLGKFPIAIIERSPINSFSPNKIFSLTILTMKSVNDFM